MVIYIEIIRFKFIFKDEEKIFVTIVGCGFREGIIGNLFKSSFGGC